MCVATSRVCRYSCRTRSRWTYTSPGSTSTHSAAKQTSYNAWTRVPGSARPIACPSHPPRCPCSSGLLRMRAASRQITFIRWRIPTQLSESRTAFGRFFPSWQLSLLQSWQHKPRFFREDLSTQMFMPPCHKSPWDWAGWFLPGVWAQSLLIAADVD